MNQAGSSPRRPLSDKVLASRAVARVSAIAFLVAAGTIHTAQIQVHMNEWNVAGLFFVASAVAQIALAVALIRGVHWRARDARGLIRSFSALPSRKLLLAVVATSSILVLMWAISRAFGIPFGPHAGVPEPMDRSDVLATMFELLTLVATLPLLTRGSGRRTSWVPRRAHTVTVGALLLSTFATTALALQPSCNRPPSVTRSAEKGNVNEAAVAALLNHANAGKHADRYLEKQGSPEAPAAEVSATGAADTANACH